MRYTTRPISDRTDLTTKPGTRKRSPFDATWSTTLEQLDREIRMLSGTNVVIEIDVQEADLKLNGELRANARPATPAVRLAFTSRQHGDLVYPCDRFTTWQDNVRAIALGMEALRKVERYGIASRQQQYLGFKALPGGRAMPASHMTSDEALAVLTRTSRLGEGSGETWRAEAHWKKARARAHPDLHDGDRTLWDQVEEAAAVLGFIS